MKTQELPEQWKIIADLVAFGQSGELRSSLIHAERKLGAPALRGVLFDLLKWLRSDLFVPRGKGIVFHNRPPHFFELVWLIQNTDGLGKLFVCGDYSLDFQSDVTLEDRLGRHQYVVNHYRPLVFT